MTNKQSLNVSHVNTILLSLVLGLVGFTGKKIINKVDGTSDVLIEVNTRVKFLENQSLNYQNAKEFQTTIANIYARIAAIDLQILQLQQMTVKTK